MKKIRLLSVALILSLFVLVFNVSCPHGDDAVKGTAKLITPQTVEGARNVEIMQTRFTIQLSDGAKFLKLNKDLDVKSWFNPQIQGLSYRVERDVNDGADTINVVVSGVPEATSDSSIVIIVPYQMVEKDENGREIVTPIIKNGTQNITVSDLKEGSKSIETQSRYAIGETPDKPVAELTTSLVISGQLGLPFTSPYSATIRLTTGRFAELESGKDVSSWFEPHYDGLTYTLTNAVRKNTQVASITISGTPKEEARGALKLTIPADCLIEKIQTPVQIAAGNAASYNITNAAASAEFAEMITIAGTSNTTLENKTFTINLAGATFRAMPRGKDIAQDDTWIISPKIEGLKFTTVRSLDDDKQNQLVVEVSGTPRLGSEAALSITIPKSAVVLPADRENEVDRIEVNTKGSKVSIMGPKAELEGEAFTINGRQGITIAAKEFTVNLVDIQFNAFTKESVANEVKNWFSGATVDGLDYEVVEDVPQNATSVKFRISGKPSGTSTSLFNLVIPKRLFSGAASTLTDMPVNMKSSLYNITALSATMPNTIIEGGQGLAMTSQEFTITLDGDGALFNPIAEVKANGTGLGQEVTFIQPAVDGVGFYLKANNESSPSMAIVAKGTPSKTSQSIFQILIPKDYVVNGNEDVTVSTNSSRYNIVDVSASLDSKVTVVGKKGLPITQVSVVVRLRGAKLNAITKQTFSDNLADFITPTISGLTYELARDVAEGADTFTINISGTPTSSSTAGLAVTIPMKYVVNADTTLSPLSVVTSNSAYSITESSAAMTGDSTITGVKDITKTSQSFTIKLTNEKFAALSGSVTWFNTVQGLTFNASAQDGSDTATITVSGAPTQVSSATLRGTIPASALKPNGASLDGGLPIDTNGIVYNISDLKLKTTETVTISGTSNGNVAIESKTFTITFEDGLAEVLSFRASDAIATLTTDWVTPIVPGLTFSKAPVLSGNKSFTITASGTPTENSGAQIVISIPDAKNIINGYTKDGSISVDTNGSSYAISGVYASLAAQKTISGFKDKTINEQTLTVNLVNATFKKLDANADVKEWFTNSDNGLSYAIANDVAEGSTSAEIKISGASTVAAKDLALGMEIPSRALNNTSETLRVDTKGSLYNISEIIPTSDRVVISGTQNVSLSEKTFKITLPEGVNFKPISSSTIDDTWTKIVSGLSYRLSQNTSLSKTATITVTGTPTQTISEPISITIPADFVDGLRTGAAGLSVNTNGSVYAIDTLSASVKSAVTVNGTKNITLTTAKEIVVDLTGSTFAPSTAGSPVSSWFISPVAGLTYTLKTSVPSSASDGTSDTATILIQGTPSAVASAQLSMTIPQNAIKDAKNNVVVDTKGSSYAISDLEAKIASPNMLVSGSQSVNISPVSFRVVLTGDTTNAPQFKAVSSDTDASSWFESNVGGLKYILKRNTNMASYLEFEISGQPSAKSRQALLLTIPHTYIDNYSNGNVNVVVNTNGAQYNISDLSASLTSTDNNITGSRSIAIASKTIKIALVGAEFSQTSGDVRSWFSSSSVQGLSYNLDSVESNNTVANITISGTPTEITNQKAMQIVIPKAALKNAAEDVVVNTKSAYYDIAMPTASIDATKNISGYRDIKLTSSSALSLTVTLKNATFARISETDVSSWFTPRLNGLTYTLSSVQEGATSARIQIGGTPNAAIESTSFNINIPQSAIKDASSNFGNLFVDTKNSTYTVKDWSLETTAETVIKGTNSGVAIEDKTFTVRFNPQDPLLTFSSSTSAGNVDETWVSPILTGLKFNREAVSANANKELKITVSGTPEATSSSPISITIPNASSYITGYSNATVTSVPVNTKGSRYEITSLYASLTSPMAITGVQYTKMNDVELEVNLSLATFKAMVAGQDVSRWFTANHKGLTYKLKEAVTDGSSSAKVTISGTPEVVLSNAGLSMQIPVSDLNGTTVALDIDTKGSTYNFTQVTASTNRVTINGSQNIALSQTREMTITLTGAPFTARSSEIDVSTWFSPAVDGLSYKLATNSTSSYTATIRISGTPTATLSAPIVLSIKDNSLIQGYSTSAPNISVNTNGSSHAISSVTASLQSAVDVEGTKDVTLPKTYEYVINLNGATFNAKTQNQSVSSWVSGSTIAGLSYSIKANPSGREQAIVQVTGRPSVASNATINFTIPKTDINGAEQDVVVNTLTSKYVINTLSASMPQTTISGSQNANLNEYRLTISLTNGQFNALTTSSSDNVRSWFADPIDGLTYTRSVQSSVSSSTTIVISGTPTTQSQRAIDITIPSTAIYNYDTGLSGITVNTNGSKYAIANVTASLSAKADVNATRGITMATNTTMTVSLTGAQFVGVPTSSSLVDVTNWFTPSIAGLKYELKSGITDGSRTAEITVSGTPGATSSSAIQMAIPSTYLKGYTDAVVVDTKQTQYNIVEATASVSGKQTVSGVTNIPLKDRDAFTITLTNATFNAVTDVSSWFVPSINGLTYSLSKSVSAGDTSLSVKISGTPTAESNETLSIRIPRSAIRNSGSSFGTLYADNNRYLTVDTLDSVYAISSASATIASTTTISGVKSITPTSAQTFKIALQAATFAAVNLADSTGARDWFTNPIAGLTYAISASSGASEATVTISGTPTVSANASIGIIIPQRYLTFDGNSASKNIVVDANSSVYDIKEASAAITSSNALVINGIRNAQITNQTIDIALTNAQFKNASVQNVVSWVSPAINGLTYSFTRTSSTRGTITISGTPTVESSAVISVNIPYTEITNAASSLSSLSVDTKNSHYTIGGTSATVRSALNITGTKGIRLQKTSQSFIIDISGALFKPSRALSVDDWISNRNNLSFSGTTSADGKSITITPSGVPSQSSSATLVVTIPTSALQGTVTESVVVNTNGLQYSIDEVTASINTRLQVDGILNRQITASNSRTVTLSGNDVTLTGITTSTALGSATYVQPIVPGLTYTITSTAAKSFAFRIAGTPTQTSVSTLAITIPRSNIKDADAAYFPANVTVNTLNSVYNINEASATITSMNSTTSAATVTAVQNVALEAAQLVQINLDAATFTAKSANADVSSWFTNRIDGFTYRLNSAITASSTVAVVKIEGAPRVQSNERVVVKLPIGSTSLTKELVADSNSSVYNVTGASASIANKLEVKGSNGAEIANGTYALTITLTGVKFASVSNLDVSSWFSPTVPGLTYRLTSSISSGASTATIAIAGTPTRASTSVFALTIPNGALLNATNLGDLVVNTRESAYSIEDVSLTFSKNVEISGFTNVPLAAGANDFDMTISGAGFALMDANADLDDWFTKVDGVHFKTKAAVAQGSKTMSVAVTGTPIKGSTSHIYVQQANMKLDRALITNITMDTKDSVYNIIDVTAAFTSKISLSGAKNIPVTANSNKFTIEITGINFASLTANQDVTEWVSPKVNGLTFKVDAATGSSSSTVTIKPDGTPTVVSEHVMWSVSIPARHLQGYTQNLNVNTLSSEYNIIDTSAALSATTHIVGTKEQMISPVTMTIVLDNGLKFKSMSTATSLASWFDPNVTVPGLSYTPAVTVTAGSTSMQVSVTGTPSVTTERLAVKIVIPPNMVYYDDSTKLNTQSISVDTKASEYQIAAAVTTAPLNLNVTADIDIEPQVFEIYLRGTELTQLKAGEDITDWFQFGDMDIPLPDEGEETN